MQAGFLFLVVVVISFEVAWAMNGRIIKSERARRVRDGRDTTQLTDSAPQPRGGCDRLKAMGLPFPTWGLKNSKDKSIEKPVLTLEWGQRIAYLDIKSPGSSPIMTFRGPRSE